MWNKERYNNDEKYRLRKINQSHKYQSIKKGKLAVAKAYSNKKWRKANPFYHIDYMNNRRYEARKKGICIRCFKRKLDKGFKLCGVCRNEKR